MYREFTVTVNRDRFYGKVGYVRKWRRFIFQPLNKLGQAFSLGIYEHAFARIGNKPLQVQRFGKIEDIRAKTDTLYDAFDYDLSPRNH